MCAANVQLILPDKENKKVIEEKDLEICSKDQENLMLKDKVQGITRGHVKYILSNAQLAAFPRSWPQKIKSWEMLWMSKSLLYPQTSIYLWHFNIYFFLNFTSKMCKF